MQDRKLLVLVMVALLFISQIAIAAPVLFPVIYEVPGGTHGFNSYNNGNNTTFGLMRGVPGKVVNGGNFQPFSVPAGYTNLAPGHPSANGQYSVFNGICGGQACSVVYGPTGLQTFPGLQLWQVGNNGDLAGATDGGQPVRLSLTNTTPVPLSPGTDIAATVIAASETGVRAGATFNAGGTSSTPAVWRSDDTLQLLQQSTTQAGLIGISTLANFAVGFDGEFAKLWNLLTGIGNYIRWEDGNLVGGAGLTALDDGSASGNGWILTSRSGFAVTTCNFLGNPGAIAACLPGGSGIGRTTLAQDGSNVGIGAQASFLQTTLPVVEFTGQPADNPVPEISSGSMMLLAGAALILGGAFRRRRFA